MCFCHYSDLNQTLRADSLLISQHSPNLLGGKTSILEKTPLSSPFPKSFGDKGAKPFSANGADALIPLGRMAVNIALDHMFANPPIAQLLAYSHGAIAFCGSLASECFREPRITKKTLIGEFRQYPVDFVAVETSDA